MRWETLDLSIWESWIYQNSFTLHLQTVKICSSFFFFFSLLVFYLTLALCCVGLLTYYAPCFPKKGGISLLHFTRNSPSGKTEEAGGHQLAALAGIQEPQGCSAKRQEDRDGHREGENEKGNRDGEEEWKVHQSPMPVCIVGDTLLLAAVPRLTELVDWYMESANPAVLCSHAMGQPQNGQTLPVHVLFKASVCPGSWWEQHWGSNLRPS